MFGGDSGSWSRITKYIGSSATPNLLSVLDPASHRSQTHIAAAFNSRRKPSSWLAPSPQTKIAYAKRGLIFVIVEQFTRGKNLFA